MVKMRTGFRVLFFSTGLTIPQATHTILLWLTAKKNITVQMQGWSEAIELLRPFENILPPV